MYTLFIKLAIVLNVFFTVKGAVILFKNGWQVTSLPPRLYMPCNTSDIYLRYDSGLPPGEENMYSITIRTSLPSNSDVRIKFDSEASVILWPNTKEHARISTSEDTFKIILFRAAEQISFQVKGPKRGTVPYLKSLKINSVEYCKNPQVGYLDGNILGEQYMATLELKAPDGCGRRKVEHTELIVNGETTKPGDWPWHAAIYKLDRSNVKYICGGTLISKTNVLTAAHCATIRGVPVIPEILSVVLGKYNLIGGDLGIQEREVHSVIVHENFEPTHFLDNDIALLKLKTEARYDDYVQPACIWYRQTKDRLPNSYETFGTLVGWGFDQTDSLSTQLKQSKMPIISDDKCIKTNPIFYGNALGNNNKFCAGWANGTSACNGDSGGGLMVFVPDDPKDDSTNAVGAWHVRGIVSVSTSRRDVALCDPYAYTVFTDVENYAVWLQMHMDS